MGRGQWRGRGGSSYLYIPANKSDLCVFNKNEGVLFISSILGFFWSLIWVTPRSGFFSSFDMDRFLKYSFPLGTPGSSTWLPCDLMSSNAGLQRPFCVLWRGVARQSEAERHVCGERGGRVTEQCEKDLLAHISVPDLLHNRSRKASSRVVLKLQSWNPRY